MNHNKLDSSSAGVSKFGAGADGNLYLVGLHSSVFISWKVAFPSMWSAEQCYAKQWNRNSGLGYRRTLKEVDRTLKNSLLGCKDFRDFLYSSGLLAKPQFRKLVCRDWGTSSYPQSRISEKIQLDFRTRDS